MFLLQTIGLVSTMKLAFVIHTEFLTPRVMELIKDAGIDYYTRWDRATGKGAGTEPHLGSGGFASTNSVLMIAFHDDTPLERLIAAIETSNREIKRQDDKIRLFQLPLERIV
jgi:hypothetical protein